MNVGEASVDAVVVEGEFLMFDPKDVEDRRVKVRDRDCILGDEISQLVRDAVSVSFFYTGSSEEAGEGGGMMIAAG